MANQEHLDILKKGEDAWGQWRVFNLKIKPDLTGADLRGLRFGERVDLSEADLREVDLRLTNIGNTFFLKSDLRKAKLNGADLSWALCSGADFRDADLSGAGLYWVNLEEANLMGANLRGANLKGAYLKKADLRNADLSGAILNGAQLLETDLRGANLSGCYIYGVSAWGVDLEGAKQQNLTITRVDEPTITVDNLEVAQFIYLLLNNAKIRNVIDTMAKKAVLILGRFTPERKLVLDTIREELRRRDYLPILFDLDKPSSRNLTETISTLAHMACFVIADITDAKSIPQELQRIVPNLPSLPIKPIILDTQYEYGMFNDFLDFPWVLKPYRYKNLMSLQSYLESKVIQPAITKAKKIEARREALEKRMKNDGR